MTENTSAVFSYSPGGQSVKRFSLAKVKVSAGRRSLWKLGESGPLPFHLPALHSLHSLAPRGLFLPPPSKGQHSILLLFVTPTFCGQLSLCLPLVWTLGVALRAQLGNLGDSPTSKSFTQSHCKVSFAVRDIIHRFWGHYLQNNGHREKLWVLSLWHNLANF